MHAFAENSAIDNYDRVGDITIVRSGAKTPGKCGAFKYPREFTLTLGPGETWSTFAWFVQSVEVETSESYCSGLAILPAYALYFWEAFNVVPALAAKGGVYKWTDNWNMLNFCSSYAVGCDPCCIRGKGKMKGKLYFYNAELWPPAMPPAPFGTGSGGAPWYDPPANFGFFEYPLSANAAGNINPAAANASFLEEVAFAWECCGVENDTTFP